MTERGQATGEAEQAKRAASEVLGAALAAGDCGSAVSLWVEDLGGRERGFSVSLGRVADAEDAAQVSDATCFDLASLTKIYTATAVLRRVASGRIGLEQPVAALLGDRARPVHREISVRQLLEHRSGLAAWAPLYQGNEGVGVVEAALDQPLEAPPGSRHCYSDLGFLVLAAAVEAESGLPLDRLLQVEVFLPLGLRGTGFREVGRGHEGMSGALVEGAFAATEACSYRGLLCGEVHDDNAWAMGGVAPHAGLFASAAEVGAFAQGVWRAEDQGFLPSELVQELWGEGAQGHCLGWDTVSQEGSSAGAVLSRRSRGHLGFTGTSLWLDPERELAVALLTNRVHHGREAWGIRRLRPRLHDAVASVLGVL